MKRNKHISGFVYVLLLLLLVNCATSGKLIRLQLQMTKSEVTKAIGNPTAARGSITNRYGQVIEVWEYALFKSDNDAFFERRTFYWLYFFDNRLVQWGEAGDWQREADRIYEIRFR